MLISKHDCFTILKELHNSGEDVSEEVKEAISGNIPKCVVHKLIEQDNDVVRFYLNLNNKAHKIIKEILTCEGKPIKTYLKIASSIITQGLITMEHLYENDIQGQNKFIECLGLKELSFGISEYFATGNYESLVTAVNSNRNDIKLILD